MINHLSHHAKLAFFFLIKSTNSYDNFLTLIFSRLFNPIAQKNEMDSFHLEKFLEDLNVFTGAKPLSSQQNIQFEQKSHRVTAQWNLLKLLPGLVYEVDPNITPLWFLNPTKLCRTIAAKP